MKTMGLDISTKTGVVFLNPKDQQEIGKVVHFEGLTGYRRLMAIEAEFDRTLGLWKPDLAVVEGFAYHNHNTLATLVECGTIFRRSLFKAGIPWMEVSPTTLKKWTTGNGAASKDLMAGRVYERWSYRSPSNDIVDAYALAQMGQLGLEKLASIKGVTHGS